MTTQFHSIQADVENTKITDSNWMIVYKAGGGAALAAGILFLAALISLISSILNPGSMNGWLSKVQNNWLIVIFKIHDGFSGVHVDHLHMLNLLDITILVLVGTMVLGLYAVLRKTNIFWSSVALVLPFLGTILYLVTKTAGRSAVMGAGIIISVTMLQNTHFDRQTAFLGIIACMLLLAGDFSAGVLYSNIISALFGIGYVLLITWIFLVALKLFQFGHNTKG